MERIYINNEIEKSNSNYFEIREFIDIEKSHVNSFTRTTKSGKMSKVISFERKDKMRILGIIDRANGSNNKQLRLAQLMADKITDKDKAIRRMNAAEDENLHDVAEIFYNRAKLLKTDKSSQRVQTGKELPEIKGTVKEENKSKDYNSLLPKWNKIIAENAFDIQGALETFVKENNLSKQETKDFFAKRSAKKGQLE